MNARHVRLLSVAALPLVTGGWLATAAAEGPQYTYFDAGYEWVDVMYAVKEEGGQFEGVKLDGSVGLFDIGPVGLSVFGEYFDGEFTGNVDACSGSTGTRDSSSYALGGGASYPINDTVDFVGRAAYASVDLDVPDVSCQLVSVNDDGYLVEGLVRAEMSDKVEVEVGYRHSDLSDSDISNNDVLLAISYRVNDWFALRAGGIVFDDDTGIELNARVYFGGFMGRDNVF